MYLFDSIDLARLAKLREQTVSQMSSSDGLMCTTIRTFEPSPSESLRIWVSLLFL
uniref:Uncharacterized protein n=1 Tax=Arundo donax TaxID=35708 RepID=A0A0A9HLD0_ARUDO